MNTKSKVKLFYDQLYSKQLFKQEPEIELFLRERELNNILRLIKKDDIVLDVGCGNGEPSLLIAEKAKSVIGFDISKEAIKRATQKLKKSKVKNCSFFQGDIENLNYKKSSFDFILCLGVFEYFLDINNPLKIFHKILKPGGKLYFHVWNKESILVNSKKAMHILDKDKSFKRHFFTQFEIKKILLSNGFIIEKSYGQLISDKVYSIIKLLNFELKDRKIFNFFENLGKVNFVSRFFAENLVFISKKA